MNQYTGGSWKDPFERGLKPERPDRFTGLNAFMLDPTIYQRIQTRPTYNEPFKKSEVPPKTPLTRSASVTAGTLTHSTCYSTA